MMTNGEAEMANKYRVLLLILCLFTGCSVKQTQSDPCTYYLLEDPTLMLSAEDAWRAFEQGKFKAQTSQSFNPGFTSSFYWLLINNRDTSQTRNLQLEIGTAQINELEFYTLENGRPVKRYVTGDYQVFNSRPVSALNFIFPLDRHARHLLKVDKKNESLQLTFRTQEADYFHAEAIQSTLVVGLLTGTIILMLIFGFFLFLITRERVYLFYILYVAAGWLYVMANLGYGYKYLWPNDPWFAGRARPVFALLTMGFSLHFIEYYTGKAGYRWLHISLRTLAIASYGLAVLAVIPNVELKSSRFGYYFQTLLPILASLYLIVLLITLIQKLANKNRMALFYLISMLPIVVFSVLQISYYSGGVDFSGSYLQHYGQATGYVMEAIILTFGLAYRFNVYRLEKEQLLVNVNQQQTKYAKAIITTQQSERRQLADQLHDVAGSLLSAAKLNLSSVREKNFITNNEARVKLAHAEEAVTDISEMLRNLSHAISPVMLDKVGFRQSVEKVVSIFNASGKIRVELEMLGFETEKAHLHEKYSVLYGILYELMNNISKHAQATNALVQLIEHDDSVVMVVEDNGVGLSKDAVAVSHTHGLAATQSKIHYLNGTFGMDEASPHGLIITIEIPKENDDKNYPG